MTVSRIGRFAALAFALVVAATAASLAGVTGNISGHVNDPQGTPIAGARVTVSSPSQSLSGSTDSHGFYAILNLSPDTYSVTASKDGYDTSTVAGVTVQADQTASANLTLRLAARSLGKVLVSATASVVSKTVTGDLYSVNANTMTKYQGSSGGAETLYSQNGVVGALPGVVRSVGSGGGYAGNGTLSFRGGSTDQVGFELEGIPLNRGFDAANATSFVTNGLANLEVYTGGEPADAGRSMSGYINEVIQRGRYPGGADFTGVVGGPAFNHTLNADVYGGTPDRRFTYFISTLAANADYNFVDRSNLDNTSIFVPANDPGCPAFNTLLALNTSSPPDPGPISINCSVAHTFNIPVSQGAWQSFGNPSAAIRDTVTNLHWTINHGLGLQDDIQALYDVGTTGNPFLYAGTQLDPALYFEGTGGSLSPSGQFLWPTGFPYLGRAGQPYTGGFGFYTWPSSGGSIGPIPSSYVDSQSTQQSIEKLSYTRALSASSFVRAYAYALYSAWNFDQATNGFLGDSFYQLHDNATGYTLTYQNQLSPEHLLRLDADYTKDITLRYNYAANFFPDELGSQVLAPFPAFESVACALPGMTLANGPQAWDPLGCNGSAAGENATTIGAPYAYWNAINPVNTDAALADTWKPSNKWLFDLGLRWDHFGVPLMPLQITGPNGLAEVGQNQFGYCLYGYAYKAGEPCNGFLTNLQALNTSNFSVLPGAANWTNVSGSQDFYYLSPRFGTTFTLSPASVLRFSVGRYVQQPETFANEYIGAPWFGAPATIQILNRFYLPLGFTAVHNVLPQDSTNYDFSYEQDFNNGLSFKVTPYYRVTRNQILSIPVNPLQPTFVTGYNFGAARVRGAEFLLRQNRMHTNGLEATLAATYTDSKIRFERTLGANVIDIINGINPGTGKCTGVGICGYNAAYHTNYPLEDPNGYYSPSLTQAPGSTGPSYDVRWVGNLVLDERVNGWDFVPTFTYQSGNPYGDPQAFPDTGKAALPNGPDPYTGKFDALGSLTGPSWLSMNFTLSHDLGANTKAGFLWTNVFTLVHNHGYPWELPAKDQVLSYGDNSFYTFPLGTSADTGVTTIPAYFGDNYYAYVPSGLMPLREFVFTISAKM